MTASTSRGTQHERGRKNDRETGGKRAASGKPAAAAKRVEKGDPKPGEVNPLAPPVNIEAGS